PKTTYVYDNDRRLVEVSRPDGQSIDYNYNTATGMLDSIDMPTGTRTFFYSNGVLNQTSSEDMISRYVNMSAGMVFNDMLLVGPHVYFLEYYNDGPVPHTERIMFGPVDW